jgi:hypothetical protein
MQLQPSGELYQLRRRGWRPCTVSHHAAVVSMARGGSSRNNLVGMQQCIAVPMQVARRPSAASGLAFRPSCEVRAGACDVMSVMTACDWYAARMMAYMHMTVPNGWSSREQVHLLRSTAAAVQLHRTKAQPRSLDARASKPARTGTVIAGQHAQAPSSSVHTRRWAASCFCPKLCSVAFSVRCLDAHSQGSIQRCTAVLPTVSSERCGCQLQC